jgi:hypothetical protein
VAVARVLRGALVRVGGVDRQRMLVDVIPMGVVEMPFMQVVGVSFVQH